jgi:glycosyltransferase involved in cell wall biosynthesis
MISIIIPTYNEEKTVEATVKQFAALRIPHEVIVSDGRSKDKTAQIAKQHADRVIEIPAEEKAGVSKQRNKGARIARGEFIVFLDSGDEVPDPNGFFTKALAFFEENPRLVGLSVWIEVDPRFRTISDWVVFEMMNLWFALLNNVFRFGIAAGKFQMVRASAFRSVGGFNEIMPAGEDIDFFRRLGRVGRTHITWRLAVFHSGRRFHQLGAWTTLYRWIKNALWVWLFKKSADEGWQTIR